MKEIKVFAGWIGALGMLLAYILLSFNYLSSNGYIYHVIMMISALGLLIRVYLDQNYSGVVMEIFFIIVALGGIFNV